MQTQSQIVGKRFQKQFQGFLGQCSNWTINSYIFTGCSIPLAGMVLHFYWQLSEAL